MKNTFDWYVLDLNNNTIHKSSLGDKNSRCLGNNIRGEYLFYPNKNANLIYLFDKNMRDRTNVPIPIEANIIVDDVKLVGDTLIVLANSMDQRSIYTWKYDENTIELCAQEKDFGFPNSTLSVDSYINRAVIQTPDRTENSIEVLDFSSQSLFPLSDFHKIEEAGEVFWSSSAQLFGILWDKRIVIFNQSNIIVIELTTTESNRFVSAVFSSDENNLLVLSEDGKIRMYSIQEKTEVCSTELEPVSYGSETHWQTIDDSNVVLYVVTKKNGRMAAVIRTEPDCFGISSLIPKCVYYDSINDRFLCGIRSGKLALAYFPRFSIDNLITMSETLLQGTINK